MVDTTCLLVHLAVCGWMLIRGMHFYCATSKYLFIFQCMILVGFWCSYVFLFPQGVTAVVSSCVFEMYVHMNAMDLVLCVPFVQFKLGFYVEVGVWGWSELLWLYVCTQSVAEFASNCALLNMIDVVYQPSYCNEGMGYGFSVKGIDWCCVWDDLFVKIYDWGYLSSNGRSTLSGDMYAFYMAAICRVLEEPLGDLMRLYVVELDLGTYKVEVWVVDAMADFMLGGFWSLYFYMWVALASAAFFYFYVRMVIFFFCSYLESKMGIVDLFVW